MNGSVSYDKQLWLHILDRDIKSKALPLPKYVRDIDEASAEDAIEWVKNSFLLVNHYSSGEERTLIRENLSMSVTWIKLIRGRWCLIACSDLKNSQLVVWDLQASQDEHHKATLYLPGPVIDGIVEDDKEDILIAFTIGTKYTFRLSQFPQILLMMQFRIPFISLMELYTNENEILIHQLVEVPGASHVRLLKRPYIGFAVRDGDDTNPSILNWETGISRTFVTPDPVRDLAINDAWPLSLKHVRTSFYL